MDLVLGAKHELRGPDNQQSDVSKASPANLYYKPP